MTATQVFLRFIESEYRNVDGSVKPRLLKFWKNELRYNRLSSERIPGTIRKRRKTSKTFVDDFLYNRKYTLNGFIRHFFHYRYHWMYNYLYGTNQVSIENRLSCKWKAFLSEHINEAEDFKKYWTKTRKFNFTWKEE